MIVRFLLNLYLNEFFVKSLIQNMKRSLISIFAITSLCLSGFATPLTPGEALQRAGKSGGRKASGISAQNLQLSHTFNTESGEAAVYVFNSAKNGGYMILSADDVAAPVLS